MTTPDFEPYPDEYEPIAAAWNRLCGAFDFSNLTETNKSIFDIAAHEEFLKIGIVIRVNWQEIYKRTPLAPGGGVPTGVWLPGIEPIGRTKPETERDHDRHRWGVVRGLDGGEPGYVREDGTVHDEPRSKDIH
jgi:hypothetical protein